MHFLIMMVQEKSKNCKNSQGVETSHYNSLQKKKSCGIISSFYLYFLDKSPINTW